MFWDTTDWWTDSYQTSIVKSYRRKSNYYEKKKSTLEDYLNRINVMLNNTKNGFGLTRYGLSAPLEHVMNFKFYDAEARLLTKSQEIITTLEYNRDILKIEVQNAESLYIKYYNLAITEDY